MCNNMRSLTKTVYIEVHAQGSLTFLNVGVYSSYGQWLCIDRRESSAQRQFRDRDIIIMLHGILTEGRVVLTMRNY